MSTSTDAAAWSSNAVKIVQSLPSPIETVVIGTQTWALKNVDDNIEGSLVYNNDEANRAIYGGLYAGNMISAIEALYPGCAVPTKAEWDTLSTYLGGDYVAGGKLKEEGTDHWDSPNTGATNEAGFTALPGGFMYVESGNNYDGINTTSYFWSSTERSFQEMYFVFLYYDSIDFFIGEDMYGSKTDIFNSIRLIKNS